MHVLCVHDLATIGCDLRFGIDGADSVWRDTDFVCVLVVQQGNGACVPVEKYKLVAVITGGVASVSAASRSSLGSVEPGYNSRT